MLEHCFFYIYGRWVFSVERRTPEEVWHLSFFVQRGMPVSALCSPILNLMSESTGLEGFI